jgi:hypothetical protein
MKLIYIEVYVEVEIDFRLPRTIGVLGDVCKIHEVRMDIGVTVADM